MSEKNKKTETGKAQLNAGMTPALRRNWNLRDLHLPRAEAIEAVAGAQSTPDAAKAVLKSMVDALDPKVTLVRLDAHGFVSPQGDLITLHFTVGKL
jgi:hypothetical protein